MFWFRVVITSFSHTAFRFNESLTQSKVLKPMVFPNSSKYPHRYLSDHIFLFWCGSCPISVNYDTIIQFWNWDNTPNYPAKLYLFIIVIPLYNTVYQPYWTILYLLLFIELYITLMNSFFFFKVLKSIDICIVNSWFRLINRTKLIFKWYLR
jgi:hypothetical protein